MYWLTSRAAHRLGIAIAVASTIFLVLLGALLEVTCKLYLEHNFFYLVSEKMGLLISLGAVTILAVAFQLTERVWLAPIITNTDAIQAALRTFYQQSFGRRPGHRITFLAKTRPNSTWIRPIYRYEYGKGFRMRSKSRFREGSAVAGLAWDRPAERKLELSWVTFPDFENDEDAYRNHMKKTLGLSDDEINRLSRRARQLRWILCYGIVDPSSEECCGVLSIDSLDENSKKSIQPTAIIKTAAFIAGFISLARR